MCLLRGTHFHYFCSVKATANHITLFSGTTERLNRDGGKSDYSFSVIQ